MGGCDGIKIVHDGGATKNGAHIFIDQTGHHWVLVDNGRVTANNSALQYGIIKYLEKKNILNFNAKKWQNFSEYFTNICMF